MSPLFLTIYMLICPVIVIGVLTVILTAFFREIRQAKREGRDII